MNDFKLQELSIQGQDLINEVHKELANSKDDALKETDKKIPRQLMDGDRKLNVVFVGPYAAGKSTIVSLLTGKHLATGADITTEKTTTIDWNGITVTDTPGIHTGVHEDHDAITYNAIANADLIVFVVNQNGFTASLAKHFHKLAVDMKKGAEMMLVVNKMDMQGKGNTPEMQDITFKGNIADAIQPFTRESLYTTFMVARYWEKGMTVSDTSRKQEYFKRSGRNDFFNNLNRFVHDKGLSSKLTTNLFIMEQELVELLAQYDTKDPATKGIKETYSRQRRMLNDAKKKIQDESKMIIRQETAPIMDWGNTVAGDITSSSNSKDVEEEAQRYMQKTDDVWKHAIKRLEEAINEQNEELASDFKDLANSNFGQQVRGLVENKIRSLNLSKHSSASAQKWGNSLNEFGGTMAKMAKGASAAGDWQHFFSISEASGSNAHQIVLTVGHAFGHKFIPWEATRIAARIGQVGKVLGAAGAVLGVIGQIYNESQEDAQEAQILEAKSTVRSSFMKVADTIDMEFDKNTNTWIEANYGAAIDDIDHNLKELENQETQHSQSYKTLESLRNRTHKLIGELQEL